MATGYYEPLLTGSRRRKGKFKTALYRQPDDLLVIDMADAYPQLKGMRLRGKLDGNRVVPYDTRKEIERSGKLSGNEIVWVDDVMDAFFLEIQGSGRVYLPESGETIRLAYANQNGRRIPIHRTLSAGQGRVETRTGLGAADQAMVTQASCTAQGSIGFESKLCFFP